MLLQFMQENNFFLAAQLAFKRRHSSQFLTVLRKAQQDGKDGGLLHSLVAGFTADDIKYALQTLRDWNTQARSAGHAQSLLHALILQHPPEVGFLPNSKMTWLFFTMQLCWVSQMHASCASKHGRKQGH